METALQIFDEDNVLRRVPTFLPNYVKDDGTITRMVFQPRRDAAGLSVNLERLSSFDHATMGENRFRLLRVNVGVIRNDINEGIDVEHDPQAGNPAHSLVTGNLTKGKQKQLLNNSEEVFS